VAEQAMSEQTSKQTQDPNEGIAFPRRGSRDQQRQGWLGRRRDRVVAEIERNRRGDYKVPTWVLAMGIVAVLLIWAAIVIWTP
jgi:hypothetical protein